MWLAKTLAAAVVAASLVTMSGCNSNSVGGVDPDPRLVNDSFSVSYTSYMSSCATGAALAGGICLLIADRGERAMCLAAAAGGCLVGMGSNALLDNLRESYYTREQQLNGLIKKMDGDRQKAMLMASTAAQVYAEDKKKVDQLEADIKANKADRKAVEHQINLISANIKVLQDNVEYHEKALESYKGARDGIVADGKITAKERKALQECDKQIAQLSNNINSIKERILSYTEDRNVLNILNEKGTAVEAA